MFNEKSFFKEDKRRLSLGKNKNKKDLEEQMKIVQLERCCLEEKENF